MAERPSIKVTHKGYSQPDPTDPRQAKTSQGARTREQALIDARPATHRPGERPRLSGPTGSGLGTLMGEVATNMVTGRPLP
jgi:hypothetical protein